MDIFWRLYCLDELNKYLVIVHHPEQQWCKNISMNTLLLYLTNPAIHTKILLTRLNIRKEHEVIKTTMKVVHHVI